MDNVDSYKETDSETLTYTTRFKAKKEGTYAFCLDNRKSHFASRTVQVSHERIPQVAPYLFLPSQNVLNLVTFYELASLV